MCLCPEQTEAASRDETCFVMTLRASRWLSGKRTHLPVQEAQEMLVPYLGWENPLEKEMATNSSILAWEIPWAEEPGKLQIRGSQGVQHRFVTEHTHTCMLLALTCRLISVVTMLKKGSSQVSHKAMCLLDCSG